MTKTKCKHCQKKTVTKTSPTRLTAFCGGCGKCKCRVCEASVLHESPGK